MFHYSIVGRFLVFNFWDLIILFVYLISSNYKRAKTCQTFWKMYFYLNDKPNHNTGLYQNYSINAFSRIARCLADSFPWRVMGRDNSESRLWLCRRLTTNPPPPFIGFQYIDNVNVDQKGGGFQQYKLLCLPTEKEPEHSLKYVCSWSWTMQSWSQKPPYSVALNCEKRKSRCRRRRDCCGVFC